MSSQVSKVCEGIWEVSSWVKLGPGVQFPARSTIVRLSGGGLLVHSPVSFSEEIAAEIRKLGDVRFVLSPNLFHHIFLKKALGQFPEARLLASPGLAEKCPELSISQTLGQATDQAQTSNLPAELSEDFASVFVRGTPKINEVVLLHKDSRTLLVGDYFFNVQETRGFMTPLVLKMVGAYQRPTQSKLWRKVVLDKNALRESAQSVLALDYQRVIMCHGDVVEDGRDFTRAALKWLEP